MGQILECGLRRNGRSRESEAPLMRRGREDGEDLGDLGDRRGRGFGTSGFRLCALFAGVYFSFLDFCFPAWAAAFMRWRQSWMADQSALRAAAGAKRLESKST